MKARKTNKKDHQSRKLVFVDIENYAGAPVLDQKQVAEVRGSLTELIGITPSDLVVVATSHTSNFVNAQMAWRGPRHVGKWGHDGADLALIETMKQYDLATFSEVYVVTGDGIFADAVDEIAAAGNIVTVVSRIGALSRKLKNVAPRVMAA